MIYKVISDNGYKIELIRPIRGDQFSLGQSVEVTKNKQVTSLVQLFDNLLDEETRQLLASSTSKAGGGSTSNKPASGMTGQVSEQSSGQSSGQVQCQVQSKAKC